MTMDNRVLNILQQLIRIRTHQPEGDEADAVKYILTLLDPARMSHQIVQHGQNRASLLVRIKGKGQYPPVLLMGHLDTIGLESTREWKHYPYSADFDGSCVYGRGANNKGGVTAMILAAEILAKKDNLPCDVLFAFTADNDESGLGAKTLVEGSFLEDVGEIIFVQPTDCNVGIAQKGIAWLSLEVHGHSSHAAFPRQNVDLIKLALDYHKRFCLSLRAEESHPYLGTNTCVITQLQSKGFARYMLPREVKCSIDVRFLPSFNENRIYNLIGETSKDLSKKNPECVFTVRVDNFRAPCAMDDESPNIKKIEQIYKQLKYKQKKTGIYYLCDVSLVVPRLGVPFSIIGPGEDIYRSNRDEGIHIEDILKMARFYESYIMHMQ